MAGRIKAAGQAYFLSEDKARQIIKAVHAPTLSPLSSHLKRGDQGRSIISNFMTQVEIFMSTTAKVGLVALVLVLVGIFGYTQLGSKPSDYAALPAGTDNASGESANDSQKTATAEKGSGNVDDAVSVILASAASESLVLGEEEADASLINNDSQELLDLSQSINDNDF